MILFKKIKFKNFLSTGNQFTEIDFDKSNTTLIVGANGAGKSTVLDALTFSLFGKSFRGINKPQLINSTNEKDCLVEIEFSIGTIDWKVCRGIKPAVFEIYKNGEVLNQEASSIDQQRWLEQNVLKMNYRSFTQVVILGSSNFVPFMQLTAASRREVIEDLLDIKIFSSMTTIVKDKYLARIFGNSSPGKIPGITYGLWCTRDALTILAAFVIPQKMASLAVSFGYNRKRSEVIA